MKTVAKSLFPFFVICCILVGTTMIIASGVKASENLTTRAIVSKETSRCIECHRSRNRRIIDDWEHGVHASNGVGCYECHETDKTNPAARAEHMEFNVSPVVSPAKCGECHRSEYLSYASSSHAMAWDLIATDANSLEGQWKGKRVLFQQTCAKCHGSILKFAKGQPLDCTWPNNGVGRINTDGTRGNCAACHDKHNISMERVRHPDTCKKCHHGHDGPSYETWYYSVHGEAWELSNKKVDFNKSGMNPFKEKTRYPTCYVCHLGAIDEKGNGKTHNPSERISWDLSALDSEKKENWGKKRNQMQMVCRNCHGNTQINSFYKSFDLTVVEANMLYFKHKDAIASLSHELRDEVKNALVHIKLGAAMMSPKHCLKGQEDFRKLNREYFNRFGSSK